jgi:hypothetical protein
VLSSLPTATTRNTSPEGPAETSQRSKRCCTPSSTLGETIGAPIRYSKSAFSPPESVEARKAPPYAVRNEPEKPKTGETPSLSGEYRRPNLRHYRPLLAARFLEQNDIEGCSELLGRRELLAVSPAELLCDPSCESGLKFRLTPHCGPKRVGCLIKRGCGLDGSGRATHTILGKTRCDKQTGTGLRIKCKVRNMRFRTQPAQNWFRSGQSSTIFSRSSCKLPVHAARSQALSVFDGVQLRAVRWQEQYGFAERLNRAAYSFHSVNTQVVAGHSMWTT